MNDDNVEFDGEHNNLDDGTVSSWEGASKAKARDELTSQVEDFLARGGKIDLVDVNVMGDPPRKPTSNYGSQPI